MPKPRKPPKFYRDRRDKKYVRPCCRHNALLLLQGPPHISEDAKISPRYKEALGIGSPDLPEGQSPEIANI